MAIIRRRRRRRRGSLLGFVAKLGAAFWLGRLVGRALPPARLQAAGRAAPPGQATALADERGVRYAVASRPEVVEVKSPAELEPPSGQPHASG